MAGLKVKRETMITISMEEETARTMSRAMNRLLTSVDHLDTARRTQLVNTGTIDAVLAMRMAIEQELP